MSIFLSNLSWTNENSMEINTTKTKEMIPGSPGFRGKGGERGRGGRGKGKEKGEGKGRDPPRVG